MVYGTDHAGVEIVDVAEYAEDGDCQGLFGNPATAEAVLDDFPIRKPIVFKTDGLADDLLKCFKSLRTGLNGLDNLQSFADNLLERRCVSLLCVDTKLNNYRHGCR